MIYLYYGQNSYLIEEKLKLFKERYRAKFSSGLNFWKLDFEEETPEKLARLVETQSMFAEKKLILARGLFQLNEAQWNKLTAVITQQDLLASPEIILVFYEFLLSDQKLDAVSRRRIEFFVTGGAKTAEFKNLLPYQLWPWLARQALMLHLEIARPELEHLVSRVGSDIRRLLSELKKLALFKSGGAVRKQDIDRVSSVEVSANIFETVAVLARKDAAAALEKLNHHWVKNEDPLMVLNMLVWQFRILLKISDYSCWTAEAIARKLKMNPWVVKKSLNLAKGFSLPELKKIYQQLADADLAVKTGRAEGREALENFVYGFLKP